MASVTLKSLTKRWGPVTVVREVSLLVADQEFVVFLGPSGSGKTTTMRMIAGLEEPTTGEIWIGDRLAGKECDIRMGETVGLRFDRRSIHLFSAASGARLSDRTTESRASHTGVAEPISPCKQQTKTKMRYGRDKSTSPLE